MKKGFLALLVISVTAPISMTAGAALSNSALATHRGLELGAQISQYRYEEPSVAVKLWGDKVGVAGAYVFPAGNNLFHKFDFRYAYGQLKYDGSGTKNNVPDTNLEVRYLFGGDVMTGAQVSFSPYVGFGYRYLFNDLTGTTSTGALGYRRYSNYWYVPLGVTARFRTQGQWVVAPTAEYDYFLGGEQVSKLSDAGIGYSDATNRQDKGVGYRLALMFEQRQFAFGPWMHYWKIQDSDIVVIRTSPSVVFGQEPQNWTREIGIEFRYKF